MWPLQHAPHCVRSGVVRVAAWRAARRPQRAAAPVMVVGGLVCPRRTVFMCTRHHSAPANIGSSSSSSKNMGVEDAEAARQSSPPAPAPSAHDDLSDYFFDLRADDTHKTAAGTMHASSSSGPDSSLPPPPPPPPPPMQPLSSASPPTESTAAEWAEFQAYLRHVEDADPDFLAYAAGHTPPLPDEEEEAAHLLWGDRVEDADAPASYSPPPPPMSMDVMEELEGDLAAEDAVIDELHTDPLSASAERREGDEGERAEFGHDADVDAETLSALKGRTTRLQNVPDTLTPPLRIPDKDGNVATSFDQKEEHQLLSPSSAPGPRLLSSHSFLVAQDRLYLSPRTPPAAQLPPPPLTSGAAPADRQCILLVFSANDLRVHDNHLLALASVRARTAAENTGGSNGAAPPAVVAVCVLDYRTFAQPSVVGGFFRQSPQRAQFLLDTVAALRRKLEDELHVPLLIRCGRPEEHVPRLAAELGATDVFLTTQYAPHERRVQALLTRRLRHGVWVSREDVEVNGGENAKAEEVEEEAPLVAVVEHQTAQQHPYGDQRLIRAAAPPPVVHSVWQTTLVHLDDLPTPIAGMKEGERWWHDDVTVSTIRPTAPYDAATQQLASLPESWQQQALLPSWAEREGQAPPPVLRGRLPTLTDLGYAAAAAHGVDFAFEEVIATQSSHPTAGEDAAVHRLQAWLAEGGMTSLLRYGRERRTNTKLYSQTLARVSPYIAVGALSPRKYYEVLREHAQANLRDGFVQQQFREALLRLSRRDYWHWMGLRFGDSLFFSYGPHPEQTDAIPKWRHDAKVVQRWCSGLTGIPFADAAMRELVGTGFVAHEGRQALAWLLTRGYGQDWRLGAEWMERCSLDYDPFVCYGNFAYFCGLLLDDFGEPIRNVHYLAHHHDQTGIYIKKWLPQLSKVPPVYIHRPHVLTARMQAMHGVYLGKNYPYPLKLWQGAQRTLSAADLPAYYPKGIEKGPGYAEALRYGGAVLPPEDFSAAVTPAYVQHRAWADALPASAFADVSEEEAEAVVTVRRGTAAAAAHAGQLTQRVS